jgi:hypothetical protein
MPSSLSARGRTLHPAEIAGQPKGAMTPPRLAPPAPECPAQESESDSESEASPGPGDATGSLGRACGWSRRAVQGGLKLEETQKGACRAHARRYHHASAAHQGGTTTSSVLQ